MYCKSIIINIDSTALSLQGRDWCFSLKYNSLWKISKQLFKIILLGQTVKQKRKKKNSSRMHTTRSLIVSPYLVVSHTCPPLPHMPPLRHTWPLHHACPPLPHMPLRQPCMPPSNHACHPATTHAHLATMHTPPATMHAPGNHAHPTVDRQTPVKT